jgi:AcrR family transcriptional regulator
MSTTVNGSKAMILGAAVTLARKVGYRKLTREDVAREAETAAGSVNYYFGSTEGLRTAVVEYAIEHEIVTIVAEAIVAKHTATDKITPTKRRSILSQVV